MMLVSHLRTKTGLFGLLFAVTLGAPMPSLAQKPEVKAVDAISGPMGSVVTITGDNFGTDASKLRVRFGAAAGTIKSVSNQVLEVTVPEGATYEAISVTSLASGLTGYSRPQFLLSYGGISPFLTSMLKAQVDFDAESGLYDLCLCDFDGDGKNDVATAGNKATTVRVLRNTSTGAGNINFAAATTLDPATKTLRVRCGDLDGDSKPDIVLTEDGNGYRVFIYRNTSTGPGNFSFTGQSINIGKKATTPEIADLDGDGKPEVIITNQDVNTLTVLQNQSTSGNVVFAPTPYTITIPGAATTDGLAVNDLNGDGRPEIVTGQYQTNFSNVFIVANNSTPGTLSLTSVTTITLNAAVKNIRIGDLDGDRKPDIAATLLLSSSIAVLHNTSAGNTLSFASPKSFVTVGIPVGLDFGDLDGDGKIDVSVVSINNKQMTVLNNTSTPGNINFTSSHVNVTYISRNVKIGDVDNDGKPDIVFASVDDDNNAIPASKVSVMRNSNCLVPVIEPAGPLTVCTNSVPYRLYATESRGVTYEWRNESTNTVIASGTNPYVDIDISTAGAGKYSVTAISEGGICSQTSNIVELTVTNGTLGATPVATNNGPLCVGSPLELEVTNIAGATYNWYGPNGFTATGRTPTLANFQAQNVGRYYVDIVLGTCVAATASTVVEAIDIGSFQVTYPGSNVICQGDTKTLSVTPVLSLATYEWYESGTGLMGTGPTLTVNASGNYYVKAKYPGCSAVDTEPVRITVASYPVANFTMPSDACMGQLVSFTNTSTVASGVTPTYTWNFGDGKTSTDQNPTHTYLSAGSFNVTLQVSYSGMCANTSPVKSISIQSATVPSITNPDGDYTLCPGESLILEVTGSYNSYLWNTGETSPSITVTAGGTYSVEVTTVACTLNATRDVTMEAAPPVTVTATPPKINEGETAQLNAEGLLDYLWTPEVSLSDPTIPNPIASPVVTTTYTVTGMAPGGCMGTGTVQVEVSGAATVTKLIPKNFFSPNNDPINPSWTVGNILEYPQCGVSIYDLKGIKVYEAKPYLNDWDGTFNGKRLPDGVYYYIIRCDGEEDTPKTGSITLLR
jgi:gliding motility-associated-like protein